MEGLTLTEICSALKIKRKAAEMRLYRAGIKPLTVEALYPPDTLDKIKEAKRGRPSKPKPDEP
jgi:hypothetical protein